LVQPDSVDVGVNIRFTCDGQNPEQWIEKIIKYLSQYAVFFYYVAKNSSAKSLGKEKVKRGLEVTSG